MPRQAREKSPVGMYHIMFRGNNKQNIFGDDEDRLKLISLLEELPMQYDNKGKLLPTLNCVFYAYCLMSNHVHLLYRELDEEIDHSMKRLLTTYAQYYNLKYGRVGHVFQDRFRSEPCNDMGYYITLLRYIHQNPVKAGMVKSAEEYKWSSWNEYIEYGQGFTDANRSEIPKVCNVKATLKKFSIEELASLVNEPLSDDIGCLDDDQEIRVKLSDVEVKQIMLRRWSISCPSDFEHLQNDIQLEIVNGLYASYVSMKQIARLTGLSYRQVYKIIKNK